MELTSLDYARLIQLISLKLHRQILNMTQIQKMLFILYGCYIAINDKPIAAASGPIFKTVESKIDIDDSINGFEDSKISLLRKNNWVIQSSIKIVNRLHSIDTYSLANWSCKKGSPWNETLFGDNPKDFGSMIEDKLIKEYFKK